MRELGKQGPPASQPQSFLCMLAEHPANGKKGDVLEMALLLGILYQLLIETKTKRIGYTKRSQFRDCLKGRWMQRVRVLFGTIVSVCFSSVAVGERQETHSHALFLHCHYLLMILSLPLGGVIGLLQKLFLLWLFQASEKYKKQNNEHLYCLLSTLIHKTFREC